MVGFREDRFRTTQTPLDGSQRGRDRLRCAAEPRFLANGTIIAFSQQAVAKIVSPVNPWLAWLTLRSRRSLPACHSLRAHSQGVPKASRPAPKTIPRASPPSARERGPKGAREATRRREPPRLPAGGDAAGLRRACPASACPGASVGDDLMVADTGRRHKLLPLNPFQAPACTHAWSMIARQATVACRRRPGLVSEVARLGCDRLTSDAVIS